MASWRTAIRSSGSREPATAISTRAHSTGPSRILGSCPVRSRTTPRAASVPPSTTASASCGRSTGSAEPRSMPAVSGVRKMSRHAASAGRAHTAATSTASTTSTAASSGRSALATPSPAAPVTAGTATQRLLRNRSPRPFQGSAGDGGAAGPPCGTGERSVTLAIGHRLAAGPAAQMAEAPGEPAQFGSAPCRLHGEEDQDSHRRRGGDADPGAERPAQPVRRSRWR